MIAESVSALEPEVVPLADAHGRVLRQAITASSDLPAFDCSAMDGYALDAADSDARFRVVAEIQPGSGLAARLKPGECARIFTGAPVPSGATQVIIQEHVKREGDWIVPQSRDARTWIRKRGEEARAGDALLAAGERLRAGGVSLLAQLGVTQPLVSRKPRALHFTTGNELVDPSETPATGQIRDSNSALIAGLLAENGAALVKQGRCSDSLDELVNAISVSPTSEWDLLFISGGASAGAYDFGARALERLGFVIHFRKINIRPGKPLVFGTRGAQSAFVIPGNPLAHFVTFQTVIRFAIERMEGAASPWKLFQIELAEGIPAMPDARETWWPAIVKTDDGTLRALPLSWQSSGDLRVLPAANALLRIEPGAAPQERGGIVECLLVDLPA